MWAGVLILSVRCTRPAAKRGLVKDSYFARLLPPKGRLAGRFLARGFARFALTVLRLVFLTFTALRLAALSLERLDLLRVFAETAA